MYSLVHCPSPTNLRPESWNRASVLEVGGELPRVMCRCHGVVDNLLSFHFIGHMSLKSGRHMGSSMLNIT